MTRNTIVDLDSFLFKCYFQMFAYPNHLKPNPVFRRESTEIDMHISTILDHGQAHRVIVDFNKV